MKIYYFMLDAVPHPNKPEREECVGAYVNCWVKSINEKRALNKAIKYVSNEGWKVVTIEDKFIVNRNMYEGDSEFEESLECFDEAMKVGISALFYTWSSEDEE
ncbi:hypothetical protein [Paenisporosarcina sp. OV554]|uniref:hypothetical protein n=1 Tax=Paenisporosarcina sp. OV554 TaxID=2135694 RepID=UPI000D33CA11|nr:hypothetical protein [Paenisporosarcina sp. OV554]PUB08249.1 hypothetical protein C8K15_13811 [Paenisporosarcina sp. OV554]